jgi:hypothetical protein
MRVPSLQADGMSYHLAQGSVSSGLERVHRALSRHTSRSRLMVVSNAGTLEEPLEEVMSGELLEHPSS